MGSEESDIRRCTGVGKHATMRPEDAFAQFFKNLSIYFHLDTYIMQF